MICRRRRHLRCTHRLTFPWRLPPLLSLYVCAPHLSFLAGETICRLLHLPWPLPPVPGIVHRDRLHAAFPAAALPSAVKGQADTVALAAIPDADVGGEDDATPGADCAVSPAIDGEGGGAAVPCAPSPHSLGVQWSLPHDAFPRVAGLLDLAEYTPAITEVGFTRVYIT